MGLEAGKDPGCRKTDETAPAAPIVVLDRFDSYERQENNVWPAAGRHILAQWTEETVVVYQAFNRRIADFAVRHQRFGGPAYSMNRMTWIKTNFLWMMYRCTWGTAGVNQERILALLLARDAFEALLMSSWPSSWHLAQQAGFGSREEWQAAKHGSKTVLQWDPDHRPNGKAHPGRRAVQIGIRPEAAQELLHHPSCLLRIQDITELVKHQHNRLQNGLPLDCIPQETVYHPKKLELKKKLPLD